MKRPRTRPATTLSPYLYHFMYVGQKELNKHRQHGSSSIIFFDRLNGMLTILFVHIWLSLYLCLGPRLKGLGVVSGWSLNLRLHMEAASRGETSAIHLQWKESERSGELARDR